MLRRRPSAAQPETGSQSCSPGAGPHPDPDRAAGRARAAGLRARRMRHRQGRAASSGGARGRGGARRGGVAVGLWLGRGWERRQLLRLPVKKRSELLPHAARSMPAAVTIGRARPPRGPEQLAVPPAPRAAASSWRPLCPGAAQSGVLTVWLRA